MDSSFRGIDSLAAMDSGSKGADQNFLLYFIVGTYFGPDIIGERPQKPILQRIAEGLPQYPSDKLAGSYMKLVDLQRVYHHVLRDADHSVIAKLPTLRHFFRGDLQRDGSDVYPQFTDLFPLKLHPQSYKSRFKIVENIVFINNPDFFYINPKDIERFKRLSGLKDFLLDRNVIGLHASVNGGVIHDVAVEEEESNAVLQSMSSNSSRKKCETDILDTNNPLQMIPFGGGTPCNNTPMTCDYKARSPCLENNFVDDSGPAMIFLPAKPSRKEWDNILAAMKTGFAVTGSAAVAPIRPIIGLMDMGECKDSYYFRVSLPGVKRDESEFSCEVDDDGKVLIRGVTTTGEKMVTRFSQVFHMQSQNLCPPGMFSLSFQLPGPIDPQQFSANFGIDGILEASVMKGRKARH